MVKRIKYNGHFIGVVEGYDEDRDWWISDPFDKWADSYNGSYMTIEKAEAKLIKNVKKLYKKYKNIFEPLT